MNEKTKTAKIMSLKEAVKNGLTAKEYLDIQAIFDAQLAIPANHPAWPAIVKAGYDKYFQDVPMIVDPKLHGVKLVS